MKKELYSYFENMAKSNRISHAFLLCNTDLSLIKNDLYEVLSKFFFDNSSVLENNPDIYIIEPIEGSIKKDEILKLQDVFKIKSQFNKNRVYIINQAEKMNEVASNKLLKFLEEPEDNIYAFIITSNIDKIISTIKSRCQIFKIEQIDDFSLSNYEEELINNTLSFIEQLEIKKINVFPYIYEFLNKKEDKENIKKIILLMKYFYLDVLNKLCDRKISYFLEFNEKIDLVASNNNIEKVTNKLMILNKSENMLEYNLNINLFIDNLIIKLVGD